MPSALCVSGRDMEERFYSFNKYLREKFGERVHRISIDAGFDCPNIDGKLSQEGCIYCNNKGFGRYARQNMPIEEQIEKSLDYYSNKPGVRKFIIYFQSFTNTYGEIDKLKEAYDIIKQYSQVVGLSISTRPDCVNEDKLKLISSYTENYLVWIEYGLQTTHNHILKKLNRGHTYESFLEALSLTRKYKINTAVHMILGIPFSTYEEIIVDAQRLAQLDIQGIKFHAFHVFKDTPLEKMYSRGEINLLTEKDYTGLICDFLERIPFNTVIFRLISTASAEYLIAPLWINNRNKVLGDIKKELERRGTHQGYKMIHTDKEDFDCLER